MANSKEEDIGFVKVLEEKYLECALCHETYKQPKSLACLHSFCYDCLDKYVENKQGKLECPICRASTDIPNGILANLTDNFLLKSLVQEANVFKDKSAKCTNCEDEKIARMVCNECALYLCEECFSSHQKIKSNRIKHNSYEIAKLKNVDKLKEFQRNRFEMCEKHDEPCKLYCKTDNAMVCTVCTHSTEHDQHKCCPLREIIDETVAKLEENLDKAKGMKTNITKANINIEGIIDDLKETKQISLKKLNEQKAKIIQTIQDRAKFLENEIHAITTDGIEVLENKLQQNNIILTTIQEKQQQKEALKIIPISKCLDTAQVLLDEYENKIMKSDVKSIEDSDRKQVQPFWPDNIETIKKCIKIGKLLKIGDKVVRGKDWTSMRNEDGKPPGTGTVTFDRSNDMAGWTHVKWNQTGISKSYQTGKRDNYQLQLAN